MKRASGRLGDSGFRYKTCMKVNKPNMTSKAAPVAAALSHLAATPLTQQQTQTSLQEALQRIQVLESAGMKLRAGADGWS
jgi:hypothetical protein